MSAGLRLRGLVSSGTLRRVTCAGRPGRFVTVSQQLRALSTASASLPPVFDLSLDELQMKDAGGCAVLATLHAHGVVRGRPTALSASRVFRLRQKWWNTLVCLRWPCCKPSVPDEGPLTSCSPSVLTPVPAVARFAQDVVRPRVMPMDQEGKMDPALIKAAFDAGLMGVEIPVEHGGTGGSFLASCLVVEELAKVDPSVSVMVDVQNTLVNNVFKAWASEQLKAEVYPRLATDAVGCFCLSEPDAGSDAFALRTRAEQHSSGDYYTINGAKQWITNGGEATYFLIMANVDPSKGYKGITCFLGEAGMPGLTVGKKEDKLGIRASSTAQIHFDNVKIPADRVVGQVGKGYQYAIGILNEGRVGIGAQMVGLAQGAWDSAMLYMHQRKQFCTVIADFQGMQHQYAQAAVEIEAARALVYNAAKLKMAGRPFIKEAAMAKLYSSQVAERTASKAIEWCGGMGFVKDAPHEKFYR